MRTSIRVIAVLFLTLGATGGCGSDSGPPCKAGETASCVCPYFSTGVVSCGANNQFGECRCPDASALPTPPSPVLDGGRDTRQATFDFGPPEDAPAPSGDAGSGDGASGDAGGSVDGGAADGPAVDAPAAQDAAADGESGG